MNAERGQARLKVLSFSICYPAPAAPVRGVFVYERLRALARLAQVEVVNPQPVFPLYRGPTGPAGAETDPAGLTIHRPRCFYLPGVLKRADAWFYYRGLSGWLARRLEQGPRPDVLDAHFVWPDGVAVSYLARRFGLAYTITLRGAINSRWQTPCFRGRIADALQRAAAVISVNKPMAEIAERLGVPRARIFVIPNGVDAGFFTTVDRRDARRRLGLPEAGPLIVSVASLEPAKGHEEMVRALARLPERVRLVIIGVDVPGGYRRRLVELIEQLGLSGRVSVLPAQPRDGIALYLNAADVTALASHSEGCPNVVIEALACGTPVVATAVGAVPELVRPGETGLIVPPKDPDALAAALADALHRDWSRPQIRASVADRSWARVAEEVLAVFKKIL